MQLRWSTPAAKDLERIFHRIQTDNPKAARHVVQTIHDGCESLINFPKRGRLGRIRGKRELLFPGLPYIAVYRLKTDAVEISRIYHAAQDWP